MKIPSCPEALTPDWLTETLRRSGVLPPGVAVSQLALSDPGSEASYSGTVARLHLAYGMEEYPGPRSLIAKFPAREPHIRIPFRTTYRSEVLFYRHLAGSVPLPVPECYAALLSRWRSLLLLEDLSPFATPGDHHRGCTIPQAEMAVSRLARFHATWWNRPELDEIPWLSSYSVRPRKNWLIYTAAWLPFQRRLRNMTPRPTLLLMRNLWRYRRRLEGLERERPRSLQHGDYRLANLAFSDDEVYAFDWQVVRSGLPTFDLAWFIATSLSVEQRRTAEPVLMDRYLTELNACGVQGYTWDELMRDYRLGLLMSIPQIVVVGAFLRFDRDRWELLGELMQHFDALRVDHQLEDLLSGNG